MSPIPPHTLTTVTTASGASVADNRKPQNSNMKTQEQTSLTTYFAQSYTDGNLDGFQIVRIPVGTFGGTRERIFLVQNGELHGFDTGNQGGGQN